MRDIPVHDIKSKLDFSSFWFNKGIPRCAGALEMLVDFQVGAAVRNEEAEDGVDEETGLIRSFIQLYPSCGDCSGV